MLGWRIGGQLIGGQAMATDEKRVRAVLAVMRTLRDRLREAEHIERLDTALFDQWLATLDGAIDVSFDDMYLNEDDLDRTRYLMHVEALIAFLEVYDSEGASVTPLRPKAV